MNPASGVVDQPRSKRGAVVAIGGSLLITLIASGLANAEAVSPLIFYAGIPTAFAVLGVGLGSARGRLGLALASLGVGTAAAGAFGIQGLSVAIAVSRNPTSHNLWPIEIILMTAQFTVFSLATYLGALIGGVVWTARTRSRSPRR